MNLPRMVSTLLTIPGLFGCSKIVLFSLSVFLTAGSAIARDGSRLFIGLTSDNTLVATLDHSFHLRYGCMYPMTYQLSIPPGSNNLKVERRYASSDVWQTLPEKSSEDFFNAIEAVRFDYGNDKAYVSAAFSASGDSLFIRISDSLSQDVIPRFDGICKYYDNRSAVVTVSADDWSDWVVQDGRFPALMAIFRSYHLPITVGIITAASSSSSSTWALLQKQLDSGNVEVASHSRTHPQTPYTNPVAEIVGSAEEIKSSLSLPPISTMGNTKYVYTWIAPYGDFDGTVDSLTGVAGYIADRLYANLDTTAPREYVYGDSTLSLWNPDLRHFQPFMPTVELGAPSWGGGDTSLQSLNALFDTIAAKGGVYHCMWHPQVIYPDRSMRYLHDHLEHISNRSNIWYVNLGHLYLYTLVRESISPTIAGVASAHNTPQGFALSQNYPNPFNPNTVISGQWPVTSVVRIGVYDVLGREVAVLADGRYAAGKYSFTFHGTGLASGVYFYRLTAGSFSAVRKMTLVK